MVVKVVVMVVEYCSRRSSGKEKIVLASVLVVNVSTHSQAQL